MFKTIVKCVVAGAIGWFAGAGIVEVATRKERKKHEQTLYDTIEKYQNIVDESIETIITQKQLIAAQEETINILEGKENK